MQGLFVTGTDTGVGKTYVAAAIVRACREAGVRIGAYKPACSGCESDASGNSYWPDVLALTAALEHDGLGNGGLSNGGLSNKVPIERICPQRFAAPLAPPSAAIAEGLQVDAARLRTGLDDWRDEADLVIVEGVGGLLCPLSETDTVADLAADLSFPLLIVAALRLGVINHTLLTVEIARRRGLPIAGILLNQTGPDDGSNASSLAEITARSGVPLLGVVPPGRSGQLRPPEVIRKIDWQSLCGAVSGS